jgi:hypothetical protein
MTFSIYTPRLKELVHLPQIESYYVFIKLENVSREHWDGAIEILKKVQAFEQTRD